MTANRVDQVGVANALRDLLQRVRVLEAAAGGGIQFNIPASYGPLNVGDWLSVTTTGDSGAGTGIAFETQNDKNISLTADGHGGIYLTTPNAVIQNTLGGGAGLLTVSGFASGLNFEGGFAEWSVVGFEVDSTDGIYLIGSEDVNGINLVQDGLANITLTTLGSGIHLLSQAAISDFTGASLDTNAVGIFAGNALAGGSVLAGAYSGFTGHFAMTLWGHSSFLPNPYAYDGITDYLENADEYMTVVDSTGAPIFQVREAGSVHIRTGTSIIADL